MPGPVQHLFDKLQEETHHWHNQAITKELAAHAKLTPGAKDYLLRDPPATIKIVHDNQDPNNWVHRYDTLHRAGSAEVRQLSAAFVQKHNISAKNPLTVDQALQLVNEIKNKEGAQSIRVMDPKLKGHFELALDLLSGGPGEALIGSVGKEYLIRLDSLSRLNPSFILELMRIQEQFPIGLILVDEGETSGGVDVSGGYIHLVGPFAGHEKLFSEVNKILDQRRAKRASSQNPR